MTICSRCKIAERLDGQRYCADCRRAYDRERYHKRRSDWIAAMGGECVMCGSTDSLEFDHIDRKTKSYNPSRLWTQPKLTVEEELKKCQLLCNSCHIEKTRTE